MNIVLQPRDLEVLDALQEWGALSITQIARRWFSSTKKARVRMAALAAAGHVRRRQPARHWPMVYFVGERWRETMLHQVEINEVRLRLMEIGTLLEFIPEVEFRGTKHRADDLVTWQAAEGPPRTVFLEVDRGTESRQRIREKLQAYMTYWRSRRWQERWPAFPPVVFVAGPGRTRQLAQWVRGWELPAEVQVRFGVEAIQDAPATVCSVAPGADSAAVEPAGPGGGGWLRQEDWADHYRQQRPGFGAEAAIP